MELLTVNSSPAEFVARLNLLTSYLEAGGMIRCEKELDPTEAPRSLPEVAPHEPRTVTDRIRRALAEGMFDVPVHDSTLDPPIAQALPDWIVIHEWWRGVLLLHRGTGAWTWAKLEDVQRPVDIAEVASALGLVVASGKGGPFTMTFHRRPDGARLEIAAGEGW